MSINFKGSLEKLPWRQARPLLQKVNREFTRIIDELNPDNKHWLVKATYPYGSSVLNRSILQLPNPDGDIVSILDPSITKELREGLSYNLNSNPVSVVLKNSFEIFLPLDDRTIPLNGLITPGAAFGAWRALNPEKTEHPAFIWEMTAGARSTFMLPKITEDLKHKKLEKTFGITAPLPRKLIQHWEVFRQLSNSTVIKTEPWTAEILYFSKDWFGHLDDTEWAKFHQYFYHSGWLNAEHWRNKPFWDMVVSLILEQYEARPNAYIMDTARYLLDLGVGALPGFTPVQNTQAGPFDLIQEIYNTIYEIRNYPPIILQLNFFDMYDAAAHPVYYSLQFPSALDFKPNSRVKSSIVSDLHEIRSLMLRYQRDFLSDKFNLNGTSFFDLFNKVQYDYFHNVPELHQGMLNTDEMINDINLRKTLDGKIFESFPSSCLFVKGCIRVSQKI